MSNLYTRFKFYMWGKWWRREYKAWTN